MSAQGTGTEIGALFITLGLDASLLEQGIKSVDKILDAQIKTWNHEKYMIKLRMNIDTAGLDAVKDKAKILEIQESALTQTLELQKNKLKVAIASYQDLITKKDASTKAARDLEKGMEQERLKVVQLEQELKKLATQRKNLANDEVSVKFNDVQKTINNYTSNLNQKNLMIKLRTEIDTSGLDKTKDSSKILEIQMKSLNQQIKNQQSILNASQKALRETTSYTGKFSSETQRAKLNVEQERLTLIQLEQELKKLASQKVTPPNDLVKGYNDIKGSVSGSINSVTSKLAELRSAMSSTDSVITKSLEIMGNLTSGYTQAALAIATLPAAYITLREEIINLSKPAIEAGDSVYVMSRGFQMSIADTARFIANCKIASVEINEMAQALRLLDSKFLGAGEKGNALTKMLNRYGVSLVDDNGHLKDYNSQLEALSEGLKKAQSAGMGREFVSTTFRRASGDVITALEDWKSVNEQTAGIVKNGLANPVLAHEAKRKLNEMNFQLAQTKATMGQVLMPLANELIPDATRSFATMAEIIKLNKDNIKLFGNAMAAPVRLAGELEDKFYSLSKVMSEAAKSNDGGFLNHIADSLSRVRERLDALLTLSPAKGLAALVNPVDLSLALNIDSPELIEYKQKQLADNIKNIWGQIGQKSAQSIGSSMKQFLSDNGFNDYEEYEKNRQESLERMIKNQQQASDIIYKITHTEYESKKHDLFEWTQTQLDTLRKSNLDNETLTKERQSIWELHNAKLEQIDKERADYIQSIREEETAKHQTELQKQFAAIDKQAKERINKGLEVVEALKYAEQAKNEIIKQNNEELTNSINTIYQTETEKRLAQIEKEKQAWIEKTQDEVRATQQAEQAKADAQRNAAMQVLKSQLEEYKVFQQSGYEGLRNYQLNKLYEQGISKELLESITPQKLSNFQKAMDIAQRSLLPNFMTDIDKKMYSAAQSWSERYQELTSPNISGYSVDGNNNLNVMADGKILNANELTDALKIALLEYAEQNGKAGDIERLQDILGITKESASELKNSLLEATGSLTDNIQKIINETYPESNLPQEAMQSVLDNPELSELSNRAIELAMSSSDLSNKMSDLVAELVEHAVGISENSNGLKSLSEKLSSIVERPSEVNTNVNINNAMAWDSEHIQELADRVADKIKPAVINAIGGNSNAY